LAIYCPVQHKLFIYDLRTATLFREISLVLSAVSAISMDIQGHQIAVLSLKQGQILLLKLHKQNLIQNLFFSEEKQAQRFYFSKKYFESFPDLRPTLMWSEKGDVIRILLGDNGDVLKF